VFAKQLLKAAVSLIASERNSTTDFCEILYLELLLKYVSTCWFWWKLDIVNGHLAWRATYICNTSLLLDL